MQEKKAAESIGKRLGRMKKMLFLGSLTRPLLVSFKINYSVFMISNLQTLIPLRAILEVFLWRSIEFPY